MRVREKDFPACQSVPCASSRCFDSILFSPRDVLEGKSEKTKLAWPKNAQPKMPCSFFHSKMKVSQWSIAFNGRWFRGDLSEMLACLSARLRNGPNVTVTS